MKKLMIAFAAVAMAACAQTATVQWNGGAIGVDAKGTKVSAADIITMSVYEITLDQYTEYAKMSASALSQYIADNGTAGTADGSAKNTYNGRTGAAAFVNGTIDHTAGTQSATAYALIVFTDANNADYVMANVASKTIEGSAQGVVGELYTTLGGGGSGKGATAWATAAVPEPTSGLLLLLGMAGLALRRRRA